MAEEAATVHSEADIRTAVEAVRAREGQLPEITLGDRGDAVSTGRRRECGQPQPRAHSNLSLDRWTAAPLADLNTKQTTTKTNN